MVFDESSVLCELLNDAPDKPVRAASAIPPVVLDRDKRPMDISAVKPGMKARAVLCVFQTAAGSDAFGLDTIQLLD